MPDGDRCFWTQDQPREVDGQALHRFVLIFFLFLAVFLRPMFSPFLRLGRNSLPGERTGVKVRLWIC
jgi:hypothetical protein